MNCGTRYNKIQTNILSTWNFRKVILVKRKLRTNSNSWKFGPHIAFIFKMAWSLVTKFSQPDEFSVGHQLVGQGQLTLISWSPDQIFSRNIFTAVFHMPQIWNIGPCTTRSYSLVGNSQCQLETYTEVTPLDKQGLQETPWMWTHDSSWKWFLLCGLFLEMSKST